MSWTRERGCLLVRGSKGAGRRLLETRVSRGSRQLGGDWQALLGTYQELDGSWTRSRRAGDCDGLAGWWLKLKIEKSKLKLKKLKMKMKMRLAREAAN